MRLLSRLAFTAASALALSACVHTPPGTSVEVALAKKAQLVRLALSQRLNTPVSAGSMTAVEPPLPQNDKVERAADAFARGSFCVNVGKDEEAIAAFEEAVKIEPSFSDAWQQLAALYQKTGATEKSLEAFRRAKKVARQ